MADEVHARTITVTGSGSAEALPDLLTISVGVECRRGDVAAAYSDAGAAAGAVAAALRRHGVPDQDVRTSSLQIRPELTWHEGEGQRVAGYVAASTVNVRLRQVDGAAVVIAAVVDAGGDAVRLNGLEPGFSDEAAVAAKARQAAWQDALRSAGQLASLASAELGQVLSVTEHGPAPGPVPMAAMQRASAVDSFPILPGQAQVDAAVTVVWELQPARRP